MDNNEKFKNSIGMQFQFYTHSGLPIEQAIENIYKNALEWKLKDESPKIIEDYKGSDKDLAIEVVARFATMAGGSNGRWKGPMKKQFVDGALWMRERLSIQVIDKEKIEILANQYAEDHHKTINELRGIHGKTTLYYAFAAGAKAMSNAISS